MTIYKVNNLLDKIIPHQSIEYGVEYFISQYDIHFEYHEKSYVFNTLTGRLLDVSLPLVTKAGEGFDQVISERFFVTKDKDEFAFCLSMMSLMTKLQPKSNIQSFTILPTLSCNARCVYCFQDGMNLVSMDSDIVEDTIDFIIQNYGNKKLSFKWFGGEPLLREDIIDKICLRISNAGIEYESLMVTNASLINSNIICKMKDLWHMELVQISMDGCEQDYIDKKRYIKYNDYYHKIIDSINSLSNTGIEVMVRCNIDYDNIAKIPDFIHDLACKIDNKDNVSVYLTPLYQLLDSDNDMEIWSKLIEMENKIQEYGFKLTYDRFDYYFRWSRCMADAGGIVIAPDGSLYCCEHLLTDGFIGSVKDGIKNDARKVFTDLDLLDNRCKKCSYFPICRPNPGCPNHETHCQETKRLFIVEALKRKIDKLENSI